MKLSRDICRTCVKSYGFSWTNTDEECWECGNVCCAKINENLEFRKDKKKIMETCPYMFEHKVIGQVK